jgi:hypothetical protein
MPKPSSYRFQAHTLESADLIATECGMSRTAVFVLAVKVLEAELRRRGRLGPVRGASPIPGQLTLYGPSAHHRAV